MTRPRCCFKISFRPKAEYFQPCKAPGDCAADERKKGVVTLLPEEVEAMRLKGVKGLDQTEAAQEMCISQSTFQRVLSSAHDKVAKALFEGRPIKLAKIERTNA